MSVQFEAIDVAALGKRLQQGTAELQLIDVREREEVAIASIPQFTVLPLSEFDQWSPDIHSRFNADCETIVLCHHGFRSARMCQWLCEQGFTQVKNVTGGIDAYSIEVDSSVPCYTR